MRRAAAGPRALGAREEDLAIAQGSDGGVVGRGIEADEGGHGPIVAIMDGAWKGVDMKVIRKRTALAACGVLAAAVLGAGCNSKDVNSAVSTAQNKVNKAVKDVKKQVPGDVKSTVNSAADTAGNAANTAGNKAESAINNATGNNKKSQGKNGKGGK